MERTRRTPSAHSPIRSKRVDNLCVGSAVTWGRGSLLARTGGSSRDYSGSKFYNEVDGVGWFKRESRGIRSDKFERLKGGKRRLGFEGTLIPISLAELRNEDQRGLGPLS